MSSNLFLLSNPTPWIILVFFLSLFVSSPIERSLAPITPNVHMFNRMSPSLPHDKDTLCTANNTNLFAHSSGGQKTKIQVLVELVPSEDSEGESVWCPSSDFWWLLAILGM